MRFRRALSLAIDRREINMAVFYGLAKESADTVLPESPLYKPEYQNAWIAHDPDQANALLDEVGLKERDDDGIRLLPDGRRAQIIVETAGESTLETDVLELITDHWNKVGISLFIRTSQRDVFRSRAIAGEIMMAIWSGIDNGVPTADMNPGELAPDDGRPAAMAGLGHALPDRTARRAQRRPSPRSSSWSSCLKKWRGSAELAERTAIWHEMLALYTDQVFSIGIVNATLQPVVSARRMQQRARDRPLRLRSDLLFRRLHAGYVLVRRGELTMLRYILWRIAAMVPTLLIISALVFTIIELPPGDYFESYIADLQGRGRRRRRGADRVPAPGVRLRPAAGAALLLLGRRHADRRFRLFLRIPAAGAATWSATGCG